MGFGTHGVLIMSDLDPEDWAMLRGEAHRWLDALLDTHQSWRERPVWQPIPEPVRQHFQETSPLHGEPLAPLGQRFFDEILPYGVGNPHPGFMGWVHGGGTVVGMLAEMLAGGLNANLGGRDHMPAAVEKQVVAWVKEWFGFPATANGVFATGTSQATLMAVWVARVARWGPAIRTQGWTGQRARVYASQGVHGSLSKALDLAGMGSDSLVRLAVDEHFRLNLAALGRAVQIDRAAGYEPFMVVGTAGTVDVGAIDDLTAMADFCARESLWFHVDGALGALACWSPSLFPLMRGIERADSLAFDFHKWGQVPYDAGFLLVRQGDAQRQAFATAADYLTRAQRGAAAGSDWPCDLGPDLSRGFRALKTWLTIKAYGTQRLGQSIERCCALAQLLAQAIDAQEALVLMAPVALNIVCFRFLPPRGVCTDELNERIAVALQESGLALVSTTKLGGHRVLRAALVNHRSDERDVQTLLAAVVQLGRRFSQK